MIEIVIDQQHIYTLKSDLNVRRSPSIDAELVPHGELTSDGQKHARGSVLLKGTRVSLLDVSVDIKNQRLWFRIPSGWICAIENTNKYVEE